jgi:fermentation-respiration switch protein FrsA (DUF1100 family)
MSDYRHEVTFTVTDGTTLSAWLYFPAADGPWPAITMAHGFGATREHGLDAYARAFREAGFAVLAHDHRGFGSSGGHPRHDIDPWLQIEDWRSAITFLESVQGVDADRIGIWGTSYSGGHAIVLGATDPRLRAVVAQVPTIDGYASGLRRVAPYAVADLEATFVDDQRNQFLGNNPATIKFVDPDPAVSAAYHSQETVDFFSRPVPEGTWCNEVTLQSTRRARSYDPGRFISRISPTPLLMVVAAEDTTAPTDLALQAYQQALEPKSLHMIGGGHYSPYHDRFDESSSAATQWFTTNLVKKEKK